MKRLKELAHGGMGPQVHSEGRCHALVDKIEGSQAPGWGGVAAAQGLQEILHVIIEFLEFSGLLQLVQLFDVLNNGVELREMALASVTALLEAVASIRIFL